ncbi:hypothetical protein [Flavihumibacter sp.]|uniref:hypothetical protein n=1 Tax=Flavihumibacter sp. TaxID=1913981 RepID=UPI002FCB720E
MFRPKAIRIASIIALILSVLGLLLCILIFNYAGFSAAMGIMSWSILIWASIIGFQLSKYKLYDEEFKKVGIRIYAIILSFVLFFFVGIIIGLAISVIILSMLWALKSNYDDWVPTEQENIVESE